MSLRFLRLILFAGAAAGATLILGWVGVPLLGLLWGWALRTGAAPVLEGGLGAMLGWAGLLVWDASGGRLGVLAREMGGLMQVPGWVPVLVTILFAGLLGGSAANVGVSLRGRRQETR